MNVLLDTNVILDDILNRSPRNESARKISLLATDEYIEGYLSANCLTDIFYIVSKVRNDTIARKTIKNLLLTFKVVRVDSQQIVMYKKPICVGHSQRKLVFFEALLS